MNTDLQGRPWAKLSELKSGDEIELDSGFTCHEAGIVKVDELDGGLHFNCRQGIHWLEGQLNDEGHLVGIYKVNP